MKKQIMIVCLMIFLGTVLRADEEVTIINGTAGPIELWASWLAEAGYTVQWSANYPYIIVDKNQRAWIKLPEGKTGQSLQISGANDGNVTIINGYSNYTTKVSYDNRPVVVLDKPSTNKNQIIVPRRYVFPIKWRIDLTIAV